jgi:hypothetical protein
MANDLSARLDRLIAGLPHAYPGPGGAIAVLRRGEVIARHAWGYANAERRIPFTPRTLFRMCSITKQFTSALLLDLCPDPHVLDPLIRARLPQLEGSAPDVLRLAHNQSGLRDYWAVAMLHGSPAEAPFGDEEASRVIAGTRQRLRVLDHVIGCLRPDVPVGVEAGPSRPAGQLAELAHGERTHLGAVELGERGHQHGGANVVGERTATRRCDAPPGGAFGKPWPDQQHSPCG